MFRAQFRSTLTQTASQPALRIITTTSIIHFWNYSYACTTRYAHKCWLWCAATDLHFDFPRGGHISTATTDSEVWGTSQTSHWHTGIYLFLGTSKGYQNRNVLSSFNKDAIIPNGTIIALFTTCMHYFSSGGAIRLSQLRSTYVAQAWDEARML